MNMILTSIKLFSKTNKSDEEYENYESGGRELNDRKREDGNKETL